MQIELGDLEYRRRPIAAVVRVLNGQIKNTFYKSNLFGIQARTAHAKCGWHQILQPVV